MVAQSYEQPVYFSDDLVEKIVITLLTVTVSLNPPPGLLQHSVAA